MSERGLIVEESQQSWHRVRVHHLRRMAMEKKKKLTLRKLSISKLEDRTLTAIVGGPPSRTDCSPPQYSDNCDTWSRMPCVFTKV